ncbi:MAG: bifunctional nuclease family protein [Planctomycetes bacterium]|nr:bifunctional nuclease family protein [Planctomycetota bacterium]
MIQVELSRLIIDENREEQLIILKEVKGERVFPIVIGIYEAAAIDRKIKNSKTVRPLTHDLIINILKELNYTISKIIISDLKKNTFYAKVFISTNGKETEIDSRPSDAIVLAVHLKTPIFVENKILDEIGTTPDETQPQG